MIKFKALLPGMFNVIGVNRKLREIWAAIDEIREYVYENKPMSEAEPVAESVATEPVAETETVVDEPDEPTFSWQTSEDVVSLKEFALLELGLTIKGNKKPETIRKEIEGFLEAQGA